MRMMGIDVGSALGYAVVDVDGKDIARAKLVESGIVRAPKRDATGYARADADFIEKIEKKIRSFESKPREMPTETVGGNGKRTLSRIDVAVLEEASDAAAYWGRSQAAGENKKGMARGTLFRAGANYGFALAACRAAGVTSIFSYLVRGSKTRSGWTENRKKSDTLTKMAQVYATITGRTYQSVVSDVERNEITEHELMALGVVCFHVTSKDRLGG